MVIDRHTFDALVEQIYRASTSEITWEAALRSIASAFDASVAALAIERCELSQIRLDPSEVTPDPIMVHMSSDLGELAELYFQHYHRFDPFRASLPVSFLPSIMRIQDVCDPRDFARSKYYQEFARRADSFHLSRYTSRFDARLQLKVALNRSETGAAMDDLELAYFDSVTTHIMRALKVQRHITQMGATMGAAFDALDQIGRAALLMDPGGRVVRMNALAESICALADGVTISNRRLIIDSADGQQKLRRQLAHHFGEDSAIKPAKPVVIAIERPSGKRPYVAEVTPFEFENYWTTGAAATALVTINDPDPQQQQQGSSDWGRALGLTRSEWRVARILVSGRDEGAIAETLGISLNTVKTHRKRIYAKLGIHRRAELTAILPGLR